MRRRSHFSFRSCGFRAMSFSSASSVLKLAMAKPSMTSSSCELDSRRRRRGGRGGGAPRRPAFSLPGLGSGSSPDDGLCARASRAASRRRPRSRSARERRLGRTLASMAVPRAVTLVPPPAMPCHRVARAPRGLGAGPGRACRARALSTGSARPGTPGPGPAHGRGGWRSAAQDRAPGSAPHGERQRRAAAAAGDRA